jgi:hypothetical protein
MHPNQSGMRTRIRWQSEGAREHHTFTGEMYLDLSIARKHMGITKGGRGIIASSGLRIGMGGTASAKESH